MDADRCICCGTIIPEGRQVCPQCENLKPNQYGTCRYQDSWTWICCNPESPSGGGQTDPEGTCWNWEGECGIREA